MNVFELFASISLDTDNYENALDDASDKSKNFESRLKTGFATAGKVAVQEWRSSAKVVSPPVCLMT